MTVLNAYMLRQFADLTMDMFLSPHKLLHGIHMDVAVGETGLGRLTSTAHPGD